MSRSTARIRSTATPLRRMISIEISARPSVFDTSGERFNVQLMNSARRSLKSQVLDSHSSACRSVSSTIVPSSWCARERATSGHSLRHVSRRYRAASKGRPTTRGTALQITAAVLRSPDGAFALEQVELAEPRADEVLVRIVAAGMCHTDVLPRGEMTFSPPPIITGHEGAGVVEAV